MAPEKKADESSEAAKEYFVLSNLKHDDTHYRKGKSITLTDSQAAPLLKRGIVKPK